MVRRIKLSIALAALVAAAAGACAWIFQPHAALPHRTAAHSPPAVVAHCNLAAELLYDVHWAATCFKTGDANDCMLPDAQAAKVNSILVTEAARCMASEMQARASP